MCRLAAIALSLLLGAGFVLRAQSNESASPVSPYGPKISVGLTPATRGPGLPERNVIDQTPEMVHAKSAGCLECHAGVEPMHSSPNVQLGCTDCHGGNPTPSLPKEIAHVLPNYPEVWSSSANPANANVALNHESRAFIKFVNPGDLRVAQETCGTCHQQIFENVTHSMMNHGSMLWAAAAYNNGSFYAKHALFGQAYGADGAPLILKSPRELGPNETKETGHLPLLVPLPRFNRAQPGNIFRIFEKGGAPLLQLGVPYFEEPPGKPERRLSDRGLGTLLRIDPVVLSALKTRLHDPLLGFMGSNDRPGDYRSSGCTACHVVYANDRSPTNSGWWSKFGHQGLSFTKDKSIPKKEKGHPVMHQFTRSIPSSQCMNCHMHQGNLFVNPYLGYTWWDQESDGEFMYPHPKNPLADNPHFRGKKTKEEFLKPKNPTDIELADAIVQNPEAAAARGLWGDTHFLEKVAELNPMMKQTQFADYHGHGWVFRAVFKKDRKGNLLDLDDNIIKHADPEKFGKAIHLNDIHLKKGMQCVDCHFDVDVHGNGMLIGEPRHATTIMCIDCHGTVTQRPNLVTTGVAGKVDLNKSSTPWGPRFRWTGSTLYQFSTMSPDMWWEIPQTVDVVDPASTHYNAKAAHAKTIERDGKTWGKQVKTGLQEKDMAHTYSAMDCQVCHSSWVTSCFGCHLPLKANHRGNQNKYEGTCSRNFVSYNPQVVRDDVFMLGLDSTIKGNRLSVLRSSSAVVVSSMNANREMVYSQQQTVSSEGYAGQAFNPHFPHTTSSVGTTKNCTDCHLSKDNDNNAIITQLLGFGTGSVNFFGRYAFVGTGKHGFEAVRWTEVDEPQAAIGSRLHELAFPDQYARHKDKHKELEVSYHHHGHEVKDVVLRGEYLYTANGHGGFEVFDVANVDNKGFSERTVTAPVSPLGQRTYIRTKDATSIALPSTLINDPNRAHLPANEEQPIHPIYGYAFFTDRKEGLVSVNVGTLFDGNPENNFFKRAAVFNPEGLLDDAEYATVAGERVYVCAPSGLAVVNVHAPDQPFLAGRLAEGFLKHPRAISVQFRYAFITDEDGFKVVDITNPDKPKSVPGATVPLKHAGRLYVARTYAYVPNGPEGLVIIDIENPEKPKVFMRYDADGKMNDTHAVQIGSVNASMFAHVADGKNGFKVLQLISPDTVPGHMGFSPPPAPKLIATRHVHGEALAVSRGLDRDRVVDESGNQTVVFGRIGARPFHVDEMQRFLRHKKSGELFFVEDILSGIAGLRTRAGGKVPDPVPVPSPTPQQGAELLPPPEFIPTDDIPFYRRGF